MTESALKTHMLPAGHFEISTRKPGADWSPWQVDENLVTLEGRNYMLSVALAQGTQKLAFYVAPFGGNVTPQDTWTGANWVANATEFTNYTEAARQAWDKDAVAAGAVGNATNPAVFTIGVGGGTIRGFALVEAQAKGGTTGILFAAARLQADKPMSEGEEIRVRYSVSLNNSV